MEWTENIMVNHYETLGIRHDAPDVVIKAAYKALSMQHHPDRGGNAELMASINAAYDVLSDPASRSQYDESLKPLIKSAANPSENNIGQISVIRIPAIIIFIGLCAAGLFSEEYTKLIAFLTIFFAIIALALLLIVNYINDEYELKNYDIYKRSWYVQISFTIFALCAIPTINDWFNEPMKTIVGTAMLVAFCIISFDLISEYKKSKKT